jgi:hypothetical protein
VGTGFRNVKACGLTVWFEMMDEECWCADERVIEIGFSRFDDENLESRKSFSQSACNHTSGCPTYISIRIKTIKPPTIMMSTSFGTSSMSRYFRASHIYYISHVRHLTEPLQRFRCGLREWNSPIREQHHAMAHPLDLMGRVWTFVR